MELDLKTAIRTIPDFPKEGILFYDIASLLAKPAAWQQACRQMTDLVGALNPACLLAVEARGFLVAAPLAASLGVPLVMVRKKGKLPGATKSLAYDLEYGHDHLEIQEDMIPQGARTVLMDDVIAIGGTAATAIKLARQCGAEVVAAAFLIELTGLRGRDCLDVPVSSLLAFEE
ncbi:MAG: adenine phosphoribosyltransferase [Alphaproteobacteria bacterium]|nr:adenine phosphoribosyltransferase [Alphaproteobacteria bacterium]